MALILPSRAIIRPRGFRKPRRCVMDKNHPLSKGLIGFWPLGENRNGQNYDVSPFGRHVTVAGTAASNDSTSHHGGLAFNTNARTAYATTVFQQITYPISMVIWAIYPSAPGLNDGYLFMSVSAITSNQGWSMEYGNGAGVNGVYVQCADGSGNTRKLHSTANPSSNVWHQYVGVFKDSANYFLYIDGVLQSLSADNTNNPNPVLIDRFTIGNYLYSGGNYHIFNGALEGARLYNRELMQADVTQLYGEPYAGVMPANDNLILSNFASGAVPAVGGFNRQFPGVVSVRQFPDAVKTLRNFPIP